MSRIFLSYRREDTSGYAGRLKRDLENRFGSGRVFLDLDLEPGVDFEEAIVNALKTCSVLLVMIGRQFLTVADSQGTHRIDKSDDHLRAEIAQALAQKIRVIPVRVHGAEMPQADALPENIRALTKRQAVELTDRSWDHDVSGLLTAIEKILGVKKDVKPIVTPVPDRDNSLRDFGRLPRFAAFISTCFVFIFAGLPRIVEPGFPVEPGFRHAAYFALFGAVWGALTWFPLRAESPRLPPFEYFVNVATWSAAWAIAVALQPDIGIFVVVEDVYPKLALLGAAGAAGSAWGLRKLVPATSRVWEHAIAVVSVWCIAICGARLMADVFPVSSFDWFSASAFWWATALVVGTAVSDVLISRFAAQVPPVSRKPQELPARRDTHTATIR